MGLKEVLRRSGLTRRQVRYMEERGFLGCVSKRRDGRTAYTAEQVEFLLHVARLRALDLGVDEAAQIAGELMGKERKTAERRLDELAQRALREVERHSQVAADLFGLRSGAARPADA